VYHRDLRGPLTASLRAGDYKVMPVVMAAARAHPSSHPIDLFDVELVSSASSELRDLSPLPPHRWFHNCNTPGDMADIGNALVLTQ
jgi:hypothetical protein